MAGHNPTNLPDVLRKLLEDISRACASLGTPELAHLAQYILVAMHERGKFQSIDGGCAVPCVIMLAAKFRGGASLRLWKDIKGVKDLKVPKKNLFRNWDLTKKFCEEVGWSQETDIPVHRLFGLLGIEPPPMQAVPSQASTTPVTNITTPGSLLPRFTAALNLSPAAVHVSTQLIAPLTNLLAGRAPQTVCAVAIYMAAGFTRGNGTLLHRRTIARAFQISEGTMRNGYALAWKHRQTLLSGLDSWGRMEDVPGLGARG